MMMDSVRWTCSFFSDRVSQTAALLAWLHPSARDPPWAKQMHRAIVLCAALLAPGLAFYLPGVAPKQYLSGEIVSGDTGCCNRAPC